MSAKSELLAKLKLLRSITPRDSWRTENRDFLLRQIKASSPTPTVKLNWVASGIFVWSTVRQQLFQPVVVILLLLTVFTSSSLAVNAAFYSLPGTKLYSVKLALERTQVAITSDEQRRTELNIEFAKKRVAEFDRVINDPAADQARRVDTLNQVAKEFKRNTQAVQDQITRLASEDPALTDADRQKKVQIALTITAQADQLVKTIDEKAQSLVTVEAVEVDEVKQAIAQGVESVHQATQIAQTVIDGKNSGLVEGVDNTGTAETGTSTPATDTADGEAAEPTPVFEAEGEEAESFDPETTDPIISQ